MNRTIQEILSGISGRLEAESSWIIKREIEECLMFAVLVFYRQGKIIPLSEE
tara:strand:+ start:755 stop:910 length:156 start_codon:yes stop_codon:yes gene_type:complete